MTAINLPLIFLKSALNFTNRKEDDLRFYLSATIHFRIDRVNNRLNMTASNGYMAALWSLTHSDSYEKYPLFEVSNESDHSLDFIDFSITIDKSLAYSINALRRLKSDKARSLVQINTEKGTIQYLDTLINYTKLANDDNVNYSKVFKVMTPNNMTCLSDTHKHVDITTLIDPIQSEINKTFDLKYLLDMSEAIHALRNYSTGQAIKQEYFNLAIEHPELTGGIGRVYFSSDDFLAYRKAAGDAAVKPDFAVEFFAVIMPVCLHDKGQCAVNTREDYQKFVDFFK